jgi:hypothetical protein
VIDTDTGAEPLAEVCIDKDLGVCIVTGEEGIVRLLLWASYAIMKYSLLEMGFVNIIAKEDNRHDMG